MTNHPQIILEDDIDACDGDQMLGIFMHKLFGWADGTKATLTKINGTRWIGCSTNRWITERKPWGKDEKVSKYQFERMLARGRQKGVLETCQWPSRFEKGEKQWKTVLHVRPADGYSERRAIAARCRVDAGPMQGFCGTNAGPVQNPDQHHGSRTRSRTVIGVPADADNATTPPARAPGEKHEAIASSGGSSPLPPVPRDPPLLKAVTPKQLWKVWSDTCAEHHGMKLERLGAKQRGQLRDLIDIVHRHGLDPVTFVTTVVMEWGWLADRVRERTHDVRYIPDQPCLGFSRYFLQHLISVLQEVAARRADEAKHDAEREARRRKEVAELKARRVADETAERRRLDALAKRGAHFPSKEAAVAAMYRCMGRGNAIQSISGKSIRAFLSSWGGDEQLDDNTISQKYRRDIALGFFAYVEAERKQG